MQIHRTAVLATLGILLQACTTVPATQTPARITTFYDAVIRDHDNRIVDLETVAKTLAGADVVVVGEFHGHQGAHLLQARLQAALHQRNPRQILALEAFNLDSQTPVNRYLAGELGEEEMVEDAGAWENYQASYRPMVEYAREHDLPVVAANAPADVVRCVGRQGAGYLEALPGQRRSQLPDQPFPAMTGYRDRFMTSMGGSDHGEPSKEGKQRLENTFKAQLLRDSTMADQILKALNAHPDHQVLMITGTFHSENRQGLVAVLEQRAPELEVRVLTPHMSANQSEAESNTDVAVGDYRYDLWPLPAHYQDRDREQAAMMERFSKARNLTCD
ncbi:ChaN family lipoprotein [Marinobacter lacisalsi]|uniref:ChaN family lipoprotein n=1 Tax=Marinobacter lacisalsi TaxID=475979 RepID=A0ABV8QLY4_9GAMM